MTRKPTGTVARAGATMIELEDVGFAYRAVTTERRRFRLSGVTFDVSEGEIVAVVGPNSAGKTTLLRLLSRVLAPETGIIRLEGRAITSLTRWEVARVAAVVPQDLPRAFPFTVAELVVMGRYPHGPNRFFESEDDHRVAREAMAAVGLLTLAAVPVDHVSGGERQRAVLARALCQHPRVLLLDEPTAYLDLRYQAEVIALLKRLNATQRMTVLLVSHDLNLAAEVADRVVLLHEGRVAGLGTPAEVLESETLSRVYGCDVEVVRHPSTGRPLVRVEWSHAAAVTPVTFTERR